MIDRTNPPLTLLGPVSLADRAAAGGSPPLRWLLESPAFAESRSDLAIAVGEDCAGQPSLSDVKTLPHLLVGGVAGSGKSAFLRAVVATLLFRCDTRRLRLFLYSSDPHGFRACEGLPHLLAPPTSDPDAAVAFVEWAHHEMDRRYHVLASAGVRNVDAFNTVPPLVGLLDPADRSSPITTTRIPHIVGVFDGLGGMAGRWTHGLLESATELCQMSRAVGIHLLLATGDQSVEALPGLLKVNIAARLSFRQATSFDSIVVLGARGAEELTEPGDALFWAPAAAAAVSLKTPYLAEDGLRRVVTAWRDRPAGDMYISPAN